MGLLEAILPELKSNLDESYNFNVYYTGNGEINYIDIMWEIDDMQCKLFFDTRTNIIANGEPKSITFLVLKPTTIQMKCIDLEWTDPKLFDKIQQILNWTKDDLKLNNLI